jgi:STE24 endopeptidase
MNESKATRYQRLRRRTTGSGVLSAGVMLALISLTPVAGWLRDFGGRVGVGFGPSLGSLVTFLIFVLLVVLLWEVASFPAVAYMAFSVDRSYGQSTVAVEDLLAAQIKATAVALPIAFGASTVVLASVHIAGPWWWAFAGVAFAVALFVAVEVGPLMLAGLATVKPISRPALTETLERIAVRVGATVASVDEWVLTNDDAVTALITGVGKQRRVLVSSELARGWSDDEIAVVVAHELAHHAYHDLWSALALNVAVLWAGLWVSDRVLRVAGGALHVSGPGDLAALPSIALLAATVWVAATPLRHAQSRRQERRADIFALAMTDGVDPFRRAIRRLSAKHLAEERPSTLTRWFYHRHPPVAERLALADAYSRLKGV